MFKTNAVQRSQIGGHMEETKSIEIEVEIEELEEVFAPLIWLHNHNETFVRDTEEIELEIEELEEVVATQTKVNHNETLVRDPEEIELDAEELEEVIAPGRKLNHTATLVRNTE